MAIDWLRARKPSNNSSTYRDNSSTAILGIASEIVCRDHILNCIKLLGIDAVVERMTEMSAQDNSKNGDLFISCGNGFPLFSIEVKCSMKYRNASITESELLYSKAKFLIGITTAGMWVATMNEVRRVASEIQTATGSFWLVPYDKVKKIRLIDIFGD
jgi:hypothetical protein